MPQIIRVILPLCQSTRDDPIDPRDPRRGQLGRRPPRSLIPRHPYAFPIAIYTALNPSMSADSVRASASEPHLHGVPPCVTPHAPTRRDPAHVRPPSMIANGALQQIGIASCCGSERKTVRRFEGVRPGGEGRRNGEEHTRDSVLDEIASPFCIQANHRLRSHERRLRTQ